MDWKTGAVGVLLGLAVGVVVGLLVGDGETVTRMTVVEEPPANGTVGTDSEAEPDGEPSADGAVSLTEAVEPGALNSRTGFGDTSCVAAGGGGERRGLGGEPLTDPAIFEILTDHPVDACGPWRIVLPVSEYERLSVGRLGWGDASPAAAETTFEVYPGTIGRDPIYSESFRGPGDLDRLDLDLAGIEQLVLQWRPKEDLRESGLEIHRFILDQAYLYE